MFVLQWPLCYHRGAKLVLEDEMKARRATSCALPASLNRDRDRGTGNPGRDHLQCWTGGDTCCNAHNAPKGQAPGYCQAPPAIPDSVTNRRCAHRDGSPRTNHTHSFVNTESCRLNAGQGAAISAFNPIPRTERKYCHKELIFCGVLAATRMAASTPPPCSARHTI